MIGPLPPPVVGLAVVNLCVRDQLNEVGAKPEVIDLAPSGFGPSARNKGRRLLKVLSGMIKLLATLQLRGGTVYMSVSGGLGQAYEIGFLCLARLRRMKVYLHHHSFAYLHSTKPLMLVLCRVAGSEAVHITQSARMSKRLSALYGPRRVVPVSNAVFLPSPSTIRVRERLGSIGFLSNICREKGVFEFLDLYEAMCNKGLPVRGLLAGPFQDRQTELAVDERVRGLPELQYVGPRYGADKDQFFDAIDVLIFPTSYANETEGIVNHEAMSHGVPVIAYGRGCIPEIIDASSGLVIDPAVPFVPHALAQIEAWLDNPRSFEATSRSAAQRFQRIYAENSMRWKGLLSAIGSSRK
jgi:glycosyltransferase involved in cell wall biosynthesis